ncbi:MAG: hypothetical protein JWO36_5829 [Myxococcales bacterium]|nr:hypothetical protein [Myxococcales bacterium]
MNYLFGDSAESDLDYDFLAFLREVIDSAVVMAESELSLASTVERRRIRETETAAVIAAVDDLGKRAVDLVGPVAKEQASAPVGRCATSIVSAIKGAVERETSQVKSALAAEREELDKEDLRLRARAKDIVDKLLRTHDLPGAAIELEVVWNGAAPKATMRQKTSFGVEAVLSLDIPANSLLGLDLRVDRIAEGVEVHANEAGGWLKKSDKKVPLKLGRYQIVRISVGATVKVSLRSGTEGNAGFEVMLQKGEVTIEPTGSGGSRDVAIEERDRPGLRSLAEKLEAATRALEETRNGLVSVEIDGKSLIDHGHPRVLAERLILAIAPTVQQIAQHSRSPGELVLRRPLGGNRREELFVSTAELVKAFEKLPPHARELFAPLKLGGNEAKSEDRVPSRPAVIVDKKPVEAELPPRAAVPMPMTESRSGSTRPPPIAIESPRTKPRTAPPPMGIPRSFAAGESKRSTIPPPAVIVEEDSPFQARSDAPKLEAKPPLPPAVIVNKPGEPDAGDEGSSPPK